MPCEEHSGLMELVGHHIFDVTTAFLSAREVDRMLFVKAPIDGLPKCPEFGGKAVKPCELLKICKSAYGLLSEAPRLWYLRACELLTEIAFQELPMCKATFMWMVDGSVKVILCLHVVDGLLVASPSVLQQLKDMISEKFTIKEWQDLGVRSLWPSLESRRDMWTASSLMTVHRAD